ncbi:MAG: energy-coupling factor transporter transmembrane protein EcfT [Erysipelotrichaceae bacterium]|nr:energy-coupling factor transporter transmembrane protein EcfT [Erysipelotrichaceae bacterium]
MSNMTLGKYIPLDSIIHKMDPRAKIIAMLLLVTAIFFPSGWLGYGIIGCCIIFTVFLAKLNLKFVLKSMKPMITMMFFLFIINVLVIKSGDVLFTIFNLSVYSDAVFQTLYIIVRLILMIMITTTLTATTKPLDLTLGIEDLLIPLKRFKVPAHEIAMLISIALRFIPDLIDETQRIMKAQASRGVDIQEGKFKEKIMAILSLIVPLFVSALQRAEDLANAMEARGFVPGAKRTRYKVLKMKYYDYILITSSIFLVLLMWFISRFYA